MTMQLLTKIAIRALGGVGVKMVGACNMLSQTKSHRRSEACLYRTRPTTTLEQISCAFRCRLDVQPVDMVSPIRLCPLAPRHRQFHAGISSFAPKCASSSGGPLYIPGSSIAESLQGGGSRLITGADGRNLNVSRASRKCLSDKPGKPWYSPKKA